MVDCWVAPSFCFVVWVVEQRSSMIKRIVSGALKVPSSTMNLSQSGEGGGALNSNGNLSKDFSGSVCLSRCPGVLPLGHPSPKTDRIVVPSWGRLGAWEAKYVDVIIKFNSWDWTVRFARSGSRTKPPGALLSTSLLLFGLHCLTANSFWCV